jgi:hypothetical protein
VNAGAILLKPLEGLAKWSTLRLKEEVTRLLAVNRAFKTKESTSAAAVQKAAKDLRKVFGRNAKLTQPLAALLDDLSKTGLLEHLSYIALSERESHGMRAAFDLLYDNHFSSERALPNYSQERRETYDVILRMLHRSLILQLGVSGDLLRNALVKELSPIMEQSSAVDRVLRARFAPIEIDGRPVPRGQLDDLNPWRVCPANDYLALARQIGSQTIPSFNLIRVEGPSRRSMSLPCEKIYVHPRIRELRLDFANKTDPLRAVDESPRHLSVDDFLALSNRAVILGDPGGGKTTYSRIMCLSLARRLSDGAIEKVPFYVTLRYFEAEKARNPSLSVLQFILRSIARILNVPREDDLSASILNILNFGRAMVVFDGLDEIIDTGKRRNFVAEVQSFCNQFPLCHYIVTSRKVGYVQVPLHGFDIFELDHFDEADIRAYATLYTANVFQRAQEALESDVEKFLVLSAARAPEFVKVPLLLALIVWLFNSTQRIPDNREEVYRECAFLLFERWDALREISADVPTPYRLFALLTRLAPQFFLDPELHDGASRVWLTQAIKDFFLDDYVDNREARAEHAATKLVEHLSGRAWVLREIAPNVFEFTHRTFLEYFFARHLDEDYETVTGLLRFAGPRIKAAEWNVPLHLALQMKVAQKPKRARDAIEELLKLYGGADAAERTSIMNFLVQATEYIQPPESHINKITSLMTSHVTDHDNWRQCFFSLLQSPNDMRPAIVSGLSSGLAQCIKANELHRIGFVLDWMKAAFISCRADWWAKPRSSRLLDLATERRTLCEGLRGVLTQRSMEEAAVVKAKFDLFGEFDEDLIAKFGLRLWQASSSMPLRRLDWRVVDFSLMLRELRQYLVDGVKLDDLSYARLAHVLGVVFVQNERINIWADRVVRDSGFESKIFEIEDIPDPIDASAFLFSVVGYVEMRRRAFRENSLNLVSLGRNLFDKSAPRMRGSLPAQTTFFEKWFSGNSELFHRVRVDTVMDLDAII